MSVLLIAIGEECFKRYQNFPITQDDKSTCESLLQAIEKNLTPTINKRYERAVFNLPSKEENEKIDQYINRLRGLIKNCQYGPIADELLLDKIIVSIRNVKLRSRLWENNQITLDEAITQCRAAELTERQMKQLKMMPEEEIKQIWSKKKREGADKK